eukprot:c16777_g1_i1.p1 GENE.c16777_g1_i1~~c16777_g1_i1.p1  ORF type:complete len:503 (+),score=86.66 c16777_g1_i1:43-1509(+)
MITPKYTYNPYVHILAPDRNTNEAAGKVKVAWPITVVQFVPNCLCDLARMVVQVFHSPLATTIIDVIVDETFIKDSEIAERLKLDDKQVRQVLQELAKAKVVREHTTRLGTPRVGSQRPPEEIQHWYIDYMSLVDATQYRYHVMMQNIRNSHIHLMDVFKCPRCAKEYTEIEVVEMRSETHRQDCPKCGASIEQVEKPAVIPQHRAAQVEQQMAPIITKLEECQKWFKSEDLIHDDSKGITTFKSQLDANKHSAPRGRTATVSIPSRSRNSSQNGGDSGDGLAVNVTDVRPLSSLGFVVVVGFFPGVEHECDDFGAGPSKEQKRNRVSCHAAVVSNAGRSRQFDRRGDNWQRVGAEAKRKVRQSRIRKVHGAARERGSAKQDNKSFRVCGAKSPLPKQVCGRRRSASQCWWGEQAVQQHHRGGHVRHDGRRISGILYSHVALVPRAGGLSASWCQGDEVPNEEWIPAKAHTDGTTQHLFFYRANFSKR